MEKEDQIYTLIPTFPILNFVLRIIFSEYKTVTHNN